ncbi:MAG TPA: hypothetical protein PK733_06095 [Clostridiales bacterium]|nr:hypothetical protein [Clostridiales bacterium]
MTKKRRRKKHVSNSLVIVSAIITLNFLGISYAIWNESLSMNVSVSTGYIDPYFSSCIIVDKIPGTGNGLTAIISEDGHSIEIMGTVNRGYEGELHYHVSDSGSVPTNYCGDYLMVIKPEAAIEAKPEEANNIEKTYIKSKETNAEGTNTDDANVEKTNVEKTNVEEIDIKEEEIYEFTNILQFSL